MVKWIIGILVVAAIGLGVYFVATNDMLNGPSVKVYFLKGENLSMVRRPLSKDDNPVKIAAQALIAGPSPEEKADGLFSEIPKRARIKNISRKSYLVRVNFNDELENYGGGSARVRGLISQIVYTFTEIPGISKVQILVNNKTEVVLGGEGFIIDKPLSREDIK